MWSFFAGIWEWFIGLFRRRDITGGIEKPTDPTDPGEFICYYGCPNSKKADKLQLSKKAVK